MYTVMYIIIINNNKKRMHRLWKCSAIFNEMLWISKGN